MKFPHYDGEIPYLTTDQMIEVDRVMIEDFHIQLVQMMENAGRNLAHLARHRFLDGNPQQKSVIVMAGTGGNGGGAMVCARRLHNYGAHVTMLVSASDEDFTSIPAHQLDILRRMNIPIHLDVPDSLPDEIDLIIDGVIGYSLKGVPYGVPKQLIEWANAQNTPVLSLDAPSGIDTTTGTVYEPAIRAIATMTLALPKQGLRAPEVAENVGELYLADISVPPQLYAIPSLNLTVGNIFAESDIIQL